MGRATGSVRFLGAALSSSERAPASGRVLPGLGYRSRSADALSMTRQRWTILGGISALVIAAVLAVILATGGSPSSAEEPEVVTVSQLSEFAAGDGHPVYWLGERAGARYELTDGADERVYVRYLRGGAEAGDGHSFVTVATYPAADGVAELQRAARKRQGAELIHAGAALVLIDPSAPDNAHLVYPGSGVQAEVFSPIPGQALRLASGGQVQPVR